MSTLFVVATPIGNLEDITLRAIRVLGEAKLVLAEDTRRTRVLLDRHGIEARPVSLHQHNEASRIARALDVLAADGDVALVSDAGTPLVSDPGERVVEAAIEAGHEVSPIPGPSAVSSALSVSGLPVTPYSFIGFLPRKQGDCERALMLLRDRLETLVFFESPHRVVRTLERMASVFGDRRACAARELTKLHEEVSRGPLLELARQFETSARGEFTIVVAGADATQPALDAADLDAGIRTRLAAGETARTIADALAVQSGRAKREIYARVIELKNDAD